MASQEETGQYTGTKDKDYNIIWFTEQCLNNALRMEDYARDAERDGDNELAEFFRRAQGERRKGAEQGKDLLRQRLARCIASWLPARSAVTTTTSRFSSRSAARRTSSMPLSARSMPS